MEKYTGRLKLWDYDNGRRDCRGDEDGGDRDVGIAEKVEMWYNED